MKIASIYTAAQAERKSSAIPIIKMNELIPLGCEISALFTNAGHIIERVVLS
jgi:hypothetical protein